ncbi:MAG: hypothetical protein IPJ36_15730, partial [Simplicispira sp.]|nr:hypothetical protein [Simplicispira sp.]
APSGGPNTNFGALPVASAPVPLESPTARSAPELTNDFLEQIARMIEYARPALGEDDVRFTEQTQEMLKAIRQPGADITTVKSMLSNFGHRMSFAAEAQAEIKPTLLHLLHAHHREHWRAQPGRPLAQGPDRCADDRRHATADPAPS